MNKKAFLGLLVVVVTLVVATAGCTSSTSPSSASASPSASASASASASPVPQNIAGYATYTNATAGIRLQYPSGWNVTEGGTSTRVVQLSSDTGTNVMLLKGGSAVSLEDEKNDAINVAMNLTSYNHTLVSTEKTTLAGMPAYNLTFAVTIQGQEIKQVVGVTVKDDQYYWLMLTSSPGNWNKDQKDFSNIFNSFAITS